MSFENSALRERTKLTREAVARNVSYLEWGTQPSIFKRYPKFCYRISMEAVPSLQWLAHIRKVTDIRKIGDVPYCRLNVPSAGNLHPIEMYVQARNVSGVLDGIYHVDSLEQELVLIREIERDGIEPDVGLEYRMNGLVLFFSIVPFRSFWKYSLRSWRYCYLDLGHQIGNFFSTAEYFSQTISPLGIESGVQLSERFGFVRDEYIAAAYALGMPGVKKALRMEADLMHVHPCGYSYHDRTLHSLREHEPLYTKLASTKEWYWESGRNASRRSARDFGEEALGEEGVREVIAMFHSETLEVVHVVLRVRNMQDGVYRNGQCVEEGNFLAEIYRLLVEQKFIARSGMVSLIYGKRFDAHTHIEAGMFVQRMYQLCGRHEIGCSGIGAFYDDEAARWSDNPLIYAAAIGVQNDGRDSKRD